MVPQNRIILELRVQTTLSVTSRVVYKESQSTLFLGGLGLETASPQCLQHWQAKMCCFIKHQYMIDSDFSTELKRADE